MTDTEKKIFELMNKKTPHLKYWMPLVWAGSIVTKARKEGRIRDDFAVKTLVDSINTFRSGLGNVLNYDWISVPLVYTQVSTVSGWGTQVNHWTATGNFGPAVVTCSCVCHLEFLHFLMIVLTKKNVSLIILVYFCRVC